MTDIRTLIRGSADIVRIATFRKGDVYKRLESPYSGAAYQQKFGIVTDVVFNGDSAMLTAIEFMPSNPTSPPEMKVFGGNSELIIFPATPDEVDIALKEMTRGLDSSISRKQKELDDLIGVRLQLLHHLDTTVLTAPETTGAIEAVEEVVDGDVVEDGAQA